jgi:hypothetical protein
MQQCLTRPWTMTPNLPFSLFLSHSPSNVVRSNVTFKTKKKQKTKKQRTRPWIKTF